MKAAKPFILILVLLGALSAVGQQSVVVPSVAPNLVPNSGFEEFSGVPLGWFYNGSQFTRLVKYWNSPTLASPDAFGPGIIVPAHWQKKGFGEVSPFAGSAIAGLTVYGCADGKPHCREYIQVQLNESLVPKQQYEVSYALAHLSGSLRTNGIGALLSREPLQLSDDDLIDRTPQVFCEKVIVPKKGKWTTITESFIATEAFNYLTIGNFFSDTLTIVERSGAVHEFGYYYIDEVSLRKIPPFIEQEVPADDLTLQPLEVGKRIQLQNIYFDLDKSDLLPRSFVELNKLKGILDRNPQMTIEIHGHTDIQGESDYNLELSIQRSRAVKQYLTSSGISGARMSHKGYGSNVPIATNADVSGRKLNRRVEILITGM